MLGFVESHLGSNQVSRIVYGAIIGLALVVALEGHPPPPGVMVATVVGTGVAVGLAEIYSETLGTEVRTRRRVERDTMRVMWMDTGAVVFGVTFPATFFVIAATGAIDADTAFDFAKWCGLGLIGFYGFIAARLSGARLATALVKGLTAALIGAFLIALKALIH